MRSLAVNDRKRRMSQGIRILNVPCTEEDIEERDRVGAGKNETTVGTLSFPVNSKKIREELRDNSQIVSTILKQRRPALLLCAGWSIPKQGLSYVVSATKRLKTVVILETVDQSYRKTYWRIKAGQSNRMGNQKFSKRKQIKKSRQYLRLLAGEAKSRSFRFSGRSVFLLICGEILIVKGRNDVHFEKGVATKLFDALRAKNAFVLNPTHTRMANDGTVKAWRRFLSQGTRLYLSASNWDLGGKKVQSPSPTLHSLWHGGKCQKAIFTKNHCDFEYREFGLTASGRRF